MSNSYIVCFDVATEGIFDPNIVTTGDRYRLEFKEGQLTRVWINGIQASDRELAKQQGMIELETIQSYLLLNLGVSSKISGSVNIWWPDENGKLHNAVTTGEPVIFRVQPSPRQVDLARPSLSDQTLQRALSLYKLSQTFWTIRAVSYLNLYLAFELLTSSKLLENQEDFKYLRNALAHVPPYTHQKTIDFLNNEFQTDNPDWNNPLVGQKVAKRRYQLTREVERLLKERLP